MNMAKRIGLFVGVNLLIVLTITTVTSFLGIQPYLSNRGIDLQALALFCLLWGFGGAFISLAISKITAKWMMGIKVIDPMTRDPNERWLVDRVHAHAKGAKLPAMPEVGIYDSDEVNAFATGPTKARSLVAVSSGLLRLMNKDEADGVLGHEVAHIANGDMVTMTLVQGVVNAFVMFFARIIAWSVSQFVDERMRHWVHFGAVILFEIGGALNRLRDEHSPVGNRDARYVLNLAGSWEQASEDRANIEWAREAWNDMKSFSTGGTYINFLTEDEGPERTEAALGKGLQRLAQVKARWDPQNVFRTNRNIKPA